MECKNNKANSADNHRTSHYCDTNKTKDSFTNINRPIIAKNDSLKKGN